MDCDVEHGSSDLASSFPRFLSTITELAMHTRDQPFLEIPTAFWRQHSCAMQEVLTLQGYSSCEWQVSLCNGGFYDGWKAFAMDHCLKKGDHLVFTLVGTDHFVVHVFDEFGSEKVIPRGVSSKQQRQLHCIQSQEDGIIESGIFEKQKAGALMHETGDFVPCHSGAGKPYGEHADPSTDLDMKVTGESEHEHELPCGIQAGNTTFSRGKDMGITAALQVKERKSASASSRLPSSLMRTPMRVLLARSAIARARQRKLSEEIGKARGTLQSEEFHSVKEENKEMPSHNGSITHSDDHVFLDSGTRCSSEHDTQNRFSPSGCGTGLNTSWPLEQRKALHSMEKSSTLRYNSSSYGMTEYLGNCYTEDSTTEGLPAVKSHRMRGDLSKCLLREQQLKGVREHPALECEEHMGITCCRPEEKFRDTEKLEIKVDYSKCNNMHAVQMGTVVGQDCGSPDEGKNAMAGREQKCSLAIAASDHTTARGLTSGSGQLRGGVSMEKNISVKSEDLSVLHEEAAPQDGNGTTDRGAVNEFQRLNVTEGKKYEALDAARAFETESKRPCVLVVIKPSFVQRNFTLGLPAKTSCEHFPKTDAAVILVDIAGKTWSALWHKKRKYINGWGWKDFALAHQLKEGDVCILEVVHSAPSQLKLLVHIFPAVEICDHVSNCKAHGHKRGTSGNGALSTRLATLVEPTNPPSAFSSGDKLPEEFHGIQNTTTIRKEGSDAGKKRKKLETPVVTTLTKEECGTGMKRKKPVAPVVTMKSCQAVKSAKKKKQGYLIKRNKTFPTKMKKRRPQHQKQRVISTIHIPTAVGEAIQNAGKLYHIVRLIDRRIGPNGVLYLVELEGTVTPDSNKGSAEQDKDGNWWVPYDHFTSDFASCFID